MHRYWQSGVAAAAAKLASAEDLKRENVQKKQMRRANTAMAKGKPAGGKKGSWLDITGVHCGRVEHAVVFDKDGGT
jgi:hypothetical protein